MLKRCETEEMMKSKVERRTENKNVRGQEAKNMKAGLDGA